MQSTNLPDGEVEELHYFKMRIKQMEKESLALREHIELLLTTKRKTLRLSSGQSEQPGTSSSQLKTSTKSDSSSSITPRSAKKTLLRMISRSPSKSRPLLLKDSDIEQHAIYLDVSKNPDVMTWLDAQGPHSALVDAMVEDLVENESYLLRLLDEERERASHVYAYIERLLFEMKKDRVVLDANEMSRAYQETFGGLEKDMLLKNLLRENSELKALNDNLQKEVTDMNRNQDKNETSVQTILTDNDERVFTVVNKTEAFNYSSEISNPQGPETSDSSTSRNQLQNAQKNSKESITENGNENNFTNDFTNASSFNDDDNTPKVETNSLELN